MSENARPRGSRLLLLGILVAPLVIAYVGLTVLLFLPLLGLRRMFPGRESKAPRYSGAGNLWDAATMRA
jgi:hypothetical protein